MQMTIIPSVSSTLMVESLDGLFEICGFENTTGVAKASMNIRVPIRIAQGADLKMTFNGEKMIDMHVDGETFGHLGGDAVLTIEPDLSVNILRYD